MSTIATLLQFGVLASAAILASVWFRLCVPRRTMRFLTSLLEHSSAQPPRRKHVHA
jgi:hypothetical protein